MAELVLGAAGVAFAGSPLGGTMTALTGFQIGVTIGSLLYPPSGPKLDRGKVDEVRFQGSSQGATINIVYGRHRVAGTIIWATGITEIRTTSGGGGKGGGGQPSVTEYSYTASLAVLVCEGTITKIRRIWANEKVIYDWRVGGSPDVESWIDATKIRVYLGNQTLPDAAIEADKGAGNVPAHKGMVYVVFEDFPLSEVGNQIPNFTFEVESGHTDAEQVMEEICQMVGLTSTDYDFTAMNGVPTRGLIVPARTEAGRILETIATASMAEIVESQGKIKATLRTGTSALTIPSDDIGASESADTSATRFVTTVRSEETELPRDLTVSYQSEAIDFGQWTQTARRLGRYSEEQDQINFPMAMTDDHARYLADAFLMERWAARNKHTFTIPYKYLRLDPGDVVTITDASNEQRVVRILEMSMGLLAQIEVLAVDDDPIIYVNPNLPATVPTGGGAGVNPAPTSDRIVFDTPAPNDDWTDACYLGVVAGSGTAGWRGGTVEIEPKIFSPGNYINRKLSQVRRSGTLGVTAGDASGILGTAGDHYPCLDTTNTVRVEMISGDLRTCTYDEMVQEGINLCLIGKEILQFQTATFISGNTYELRNLLRYRRGTDYLRTELITGGYTGHAIEEPFVFFDEDTDNFKFDVRCIGETYETRLNETGYYSGMGAPGYSDPITLQGLSRAPYGPCHITYSGNRSAGNADVTISWTRRVRKAGELISFKDAVLDEATEEYAVEIWNAAGNVLIKSYQFVGSPTYTYTIANQTTDGVNASSFNVVIRQVSSEGGIGKGMRSPMKLVTTSNDTIY